MQQQQDLLNNFNENREHHYRQQLIALQHDMNLIIQCDPYDSSFLEDAPEDISRVVEEAAADTLYQNELSSHAGKWYSEFVHTVNEAKEQREIELIQLVVRPIQLPTTLKTLTLLQRDHDMRLERLKYECDFKLHLAAEEYKQMTGTLRERLVQHLTTKRQRLLKDKEQLDIADTNALLLHPSQFSITDPSSPGGPTSRKTRNTKHRGDVEEGGNGVTAEAGHKRKRRALEDDFGSPSRNGYSTPAERAKLLNHAHQTGPAYTVHNLFTEKELNFQSHQAQIAAHHFFSTSNKDRDTNGTTGGTSKRGARDNNVDTNHTGMGTSHNPSINPSSESEDQEPDHEPNLTAPEMDRTASQQQQFLQNTHITRSTRATAGGNSALAALNLLSDLAEKASTRPSLPYATVHSSHNARQGTFLPSPSRAMSEEIQEDLFEIERLQQRPMDYVDEKAVEEALRPLGVAAPRNNTSGGADNGDGENVNGGNEDGGPGSWLRSRSNLAPNWPVYLDVHLVDVDPRRANGSPS